MQLELCRHIKTNGLQCHGVSLAASPFCYFHDRLHKRHARYRFTPATQGYLIPGKHIQIGPLEDREAVQVALSQVINALATGALQVKAATALLYGLQLASNNAAGVHLGQRPLDIVRETCTTPDESATPGIDLAQPGAVYDTDSDNEYEAQYVSDPEAAAGPQAGRGAGHEAHVPSSIAAAWAAAAKEIDGEDEEAVAEFNRLAEARHNGQAPPPRIRSISAASSPTSPLTPASSSKPSKPIAAQATTSSTASSSCPGPLLRPQRGLDWPHDHPRLCKEPALARPDRLVQPQREQPDRRARHRFGHHRYARGPFPGRKPGSRATRQSH
jgi:hypothetical protein